MQTAETPRPKRVTKRRAETRQRLLDAPVTCSPRRASGAPRWSRCANAPGSPAAPSTRTSPRWTSCFSRCGSSARQPCSTASAPPSPTARPPSPSTRPSSVSWPRFRSTTLVRITAEFHRARPPQPPPSNASWRPGGRDPRHDPADRRGRSRRGGATRHRPRGPGTGTGRDPRRHRRAGADGTGERGVRQARQRLFVTVVSSYSSGT